MEILIGLPVTIIVFALGASIGSFVNVVVYRIPAGLSIVWPVSRCPHCLHKLGKHENVPVLGWLWLGGRCRHCKGAISPRYLLVEAATGLLFLLLFWTFGVSMQTLGYWTFCSWLLALLLIDLDTMILPNSLTQSGLVAGLIFQIVSATSWVAAVNNLIIGIIWCSAGFVVV